MFRNPSIRLLTMTALALLTGACSDNLSAPAGDGESISDYVASASLEGGQGTLREASIPRPAAGGPEITVEGHLTIVNGGTASVTVSSETPFRTVYVAGSAPISGLFQPVSGFYEVVLPAPATTAELLLTFPQALPAGDVDLYISAADADGHVGPVHNMAFHALTVGTGDVQVTASWDTDADVDLHVVDPMAEEIYWANRESGSGGELDLDSNAACNSDGVSNENITWAEGTAPNGTYTVRLDYWSSCNAAQTNYTVLINNGGDIQIFHGAFTGSGDNGGQGSGIFIATFNRTGG